MTDDQWSAHVRMMHGLSYALHRLTNYGEDSRRAATADTHKALSHDGGQCVPGWLSAQIQKDEEEQR